MLTLTKNESLRYLTQCADRQGIHWSGGVKWRPEECPCCNGTNQAGHLGTPGSRYGRNATDCAPVAFALAEIIADANGDPIAEDLLDYCMGLVVNDHDDVLSLIRQHGAEEHVELLGDLLEIESED